MKKLFSKFDIKDILIFVLIIVILLMRACGGKTTNTTNPGQTVNVNGTPHVIIKHVIDTQYIRKDTVIYKKGKDMYHETPVYVELPNDVDTASILKDYYSSVTYKDTIKLNDSLGVVRITDVISKNKIQNRTFSASINKIVIRDTLILKEKPRRQLYVGVNTSFTQLNVVNGVGVGLIYKDRKDKVFSAGVGIQQTRPMILTPYVQGGLYWKIKLRK